MVFGLVLFGLFGATGERGEKTQRDARCIQTTTWSCCDGGANRTTQC